MEQIDPAQFQKRVDKLTQIFARIAEHAEEQALQRCPYKDRLNQCTAKFGCRFKRRASQPESLPICTSDDKLDYRTAWESDPEAHDQVKAQVRRRQDP